MPSSPGSCPSVAHALVRRRSASRAASTPTPTPTLTPTLPLPLTLTLSRSSSWAALTPTPTLTPTLALTLTLTLPLPLPLPLTPPLPLSRSSSWAAASEAASGRSFATRPLRRCAWRTSGRPCGTGRYASSGGHLPWAAVASTHLRRSSARRWRRSRLPTSWSAPRPLARVRLHSSKQETPRPSS